jgi:hypothetical protein
MRRLMLGLLACTIALVMLLLSLSFRLEPLRAIAILIAAGSICYGWVRVRPHLQSRIGLVAFSVAFSMLAFACAWSGLNVIRFYLYNPAMEGAATFATWYEIVCTTQVVIQWLLAGLGVVLLVLLVVSPFWIRSHSVRNSKR